MDGDIRLDQLVATLVSVVTTFDGRGLKKQKNGSAMATSIQNGRVVVDRQMAFGVVKKVKKRTETFLTTGQWSSWRRSTSWQLHQFELFLAQLARLFKSEIFLE